MVPIRTKLDLLPLLIMVFGLFDFYVLLLTESHYLYGFLNNTFIVTYKIDRFSSGQKMSSDFESDKNLENLGPRMEF